MFSLNEPEPDVIQKRWKELGESWGYLELSDIKLTRNQKKILNSYGIFLN